MDLKSVPGKKQERRVTRLDRLVERKEGFAHRVTGLVFGDKYGKPKLPQRLSNDPRIIDRCVETGNVLVFNVADDECNGQPQAQRFGLSMCLGGRGLHH